MNRAELHDGINLVIDTIAANNNELVCGMHTRLNDLLEQAEQPDASIYGPAIDALFEILMDVMTSVAFT